MMTSKNPEGEQPRSEGFPRGSQSTMLGDASRCDQSVVLIAPLVTGSNPDVKAGQSLHARLGPGRSLDVLTTDRGTARRAVPT